MNPEKVPRESRSSGREGVEEVAKLELSAAEQGLWSGNEVPYGLAADPLVSVCGLHLPFRETLPLC